MNRLQHLSLATFKNLRFQNFGMVPMRLQSTNPSGTASYPSNPRQSKAVKNLRKEDHFNADVDEEDQKPKDIPSMAKDPEADFKSSTYEERLKKEFDKDNKEFE